MHSNLPLNLTKRIGFAFGLESVCVVIGGSKGAVGMEITCYLHVLRSSWLVY